MKSFKRSLWVFVTITAVPILIAAVEVYRFAQRDEARPADAAIVLGAAVYGNRPSPVLRERINHAIGLYQQGYVQWVIFTGGQGQINEPPEAEVARQYAIANGLPAEAVLVETTSTNTWENLANAQIVAQTQDLDSFLVVSTPFHMKRAILIAGELGMEAYSSPTRTTRWISGFTRFRAYAREVAGYVVYRLDQVWGMVGTSQAISGELRRWQKSGTAQFLTFSR